MTNEPQHVGENQNSETKDTEHNIMTDGNIIINRVGKIKKAIITTKKKNPKKITYEQAQIIKTITSWGIG